MIFFLWKNVITTNLEYLTINISLRERNGVAQIHWPIHWQTVRNQSQWYIFQIFVPLNDQRLRRRHSRWPLNGYLDANSLWTSITIPIQMSFLQIPTDQYHGATKAISIWFILKLKKSSKQCTRSWARREATIVIDWTSSIQLLFNKRCRVSSPLNVRFISTNLSVWPKTMKRTNSKNTFMGHKWSSSNNHIRLSNDIPFRFHSDFNHFKCWQTDWRTLWLIAFRDWLTDCLKYKECTKLSISASV